MSIDFNSPSTTVILGGFIIVLLVLLVICRQKEKQSGRELKEGFSTFIKKEGAQQIYDDFYAEIYDQLFQSDLKNEYECTQLHKMFLKDWKGAPIKILDAGCGTGHHLRILKRYGHSVEGLDQSKPMLKKAKRQCPEAVLKRGDFDNPKTYENHRFTHIICLFFSVYYTKNLTKLFQNFNNWLKPNGMVFIHVVTRGKFDPVLERSSSLIPLFDPQSHTDQRNTRTSLQFKEFEYESDWDLTKRKSQFNEVIRFKKEPYDRQHIHRFNIINPKSIITKANKNGFELLKAMDEFIIGRGHNYVMCFRKKYGN